MLEFWEFRVHEENAHLLFSPNEGERLGDSIRKIIMPRTDPRFDKIGFLRRKLRQEGKGSFFSGWDIIYKYSNSELSSAELFHLHLRSCFEPTGEECGTNFDYSGACVECGMPRRQVGNLILDLRKAPKSKDLASTIADDEWIVTQCLAERLIDEKLTGFDLQRVKHKARYDDDSVDLRTVRSGQELIRRARAIGIEHEKTNNDTVAFNNWLNRPEQNELWEQALAENAESKRKSARQRGTRPPVWYQLIITSQRMSMMVPPTSVGDGPFDVDIGARHRCSRGHVVGLNLLSEITVARDEWDGTDLCCTKQLIGMPRRPGAMHGVRVPAPCLLMSPRFREVLLRHKIKGWSAEIAYLR